jgi:hypothetical protein
MVDAGMENNKKMNGQNGTFFKRTSFNLRTQPRERNAFLPAMSHKGGRKVMRQRKRDTQNGTDLFFA